MVTVSLIHPEAAGAGQEVSLIWLYLAIGNGKSTADTSFDSKPRATRLQKWMCHLWVIYVV